MPLRTPQRDQTRAFSLVLCLVVLALLSIVIISFISTTSLDRITARAFANKGLAELAAQTAVNQAASLLAERIAQYPDSVTVWERIEAPGGSSTAPGQPGFEGTVLYMNDGPNDPTAKRRVLPLVSRPDAEGNLLEELPIGDKADALGTGVWTNDNSIDLNRPRSNTDQTGWIGVHPDAKRREYRARWIEIKGAAPPGASAPAIARYAFWVEDESFRLNLNLLGNVARGTELAESERERTRAAEHSQPRFSAAEKTPFQGLLRSLRAPPTLDHEAIAMSARALRDGWFDRRLLDLSGFNHAHAAYRLGDQATFLGTIHSSALNLSRHGTQRVNLNDIVGVEEASAPSTKPYEPSDREIERQVYQIYEALRFHGSDKTQRMKFGQRFYRTSANADRNLEQVAQTPSAPHQEIYVYKVAANIRDYIDPDLQPTILLRALGGTRPRVMPRGEPVSAINADPAAPPTSDIWAHGKDSGLFLQEAVVRYRTQVTGSRYNLQVDYYLEFWNMGSRDIFAAGISGLGPSRTLGHRPFVRISNQQAWLSYPSGLPLRADDLPAGDPVQNPARDLVIDIESGVFQNGAPQPAGVTFRAGACTVITTDPDYQTTPAFGSSSPAYSGGYNRANIYFCSNLRDSTNTVPGKRRYTGALRSKADTGVKPDFREGTEDYDTEVILGNGRGIIDSHPAAVAMGGGAKIANAKSGPRDDWYGGTLLGNGTTRSQLGDPRTNNEQLEFTRFLGHASTSQPDQGRYFNSVNSPRFSLGHPNDLYVNPQKAFAWPDYYKGWEQTSTGSALNPAAVNAPAFLANEPLTSIGQLGDVFDPARMTGAVGTLGIGAARGGGRTFRVGQPDDLIDMSTVSAPSQQWASWRLADFFSTTSDLYQPGLININGLRRDDGAAVKAACYGLRLNSVSQSISASVPRTDECALDLGEEHGTGVQRFIDEAIARLNEPDSAKPSYFRERGEISELDVFRSPTPDEFLPGIRMSEAFDRTREEFARRLLEMITTRGSVFSVYAVGQAVTQHNVPGRTLHVTGEHWTKVTFGLFPRNADGSDFQTNRETFDPDDPVSRERRFDHPHHYEVRILQVHSY